MSGQPTFLFSSLTVALGGGIGAWLRFAVGRIAGFSAYPWATLLVNVSGSFAMGLLAGWLARHSADGEFWRLLLGVGLLGGFTTFSAFSLELVNLAQRGSIGLAFGYALISVLAGVLGLFAGLAIMRVAT
jgi:CrcB protein